MRIGGKTVTWGELKQTAEEMKIPDDMPVYVNNHFMYDEGITIVTARKQGGASKDCPTIALVLRTYS